MFSYTFRSIWNKKGGFFFPLHIFKMGCFWKKVSEPHLHPNCSPFPQSTVRQTVGWHLGISGAEKLLVVAELLKSKRERDEWIFCFGSHQLADLLLGALPSSSLQQPCSCSRLGWNTTGTKPPSALDKDSAFKLANRCLGIVALLHHI